MPDSDSATRRTVCHRVGSLALAGAATVTGLTDAQTTVDRGTPNTDGLECYRGVVDRIVDDRFVVILLEEDGEVVAELVEPRTDLPPLSESERVLVVLVDGELNTVIPLS